MIGRYMKSIHAQPSKDDQSHTNATCYNCHDAHYVYPQGTPNRNWWRLNLPYTCGACHTAELAEYKTSVHGQETLLEGNPKAAICSDCHTTHDIQDPFLDKTQLLITKNCGSCHKEELESYQGPTTARSTRSASPTPPSASTATATTRSSASTIRPRAFIRPTACRPARSAISTRPTAS